MNTARGSVLDYEALCRGLRSGHIRGAALDVFEEEPPHSASAPAIERLNFLIEQEHVLLTPHVAGSSSASYLRIAQVLLDKIERFLNQASAPSTT